MSYSGRMSLAMVAAAAIVAALFASAPNLLRRIDAVALIPPPEKAVVLNLRDLEPVPRPEPPQTDPIKRLVDAGAPTDAPSQDTDLISSAESKAQDMSDQQGDPNRAAAQTIDDFDQLSASAAQPVPPAPETPPVEQPVAEETPAPETPAKQPVEDAPAPQPSPEPAKPPAETKPVAQPEPEAEKKGDPAPKESEPARQEVIAAAEPPKKEPKPVEEKPREAAKEKPAEKAPLPEPFKVAQATPPGQIPMEELHVERGREGGGAVDKGSTSFAANKHVLGEYMLGVRKRVERQWRTALHLRYNGASRTDAIIHCVIRPDGTIESVSIVDPGDSLTYAVLCREAVQEAGPFGPFPFDVPEIYRTKNLELNWRFSYL